MMPKTSRPSAPALSTAPSRSSPRRAASRDEAPPSAVPSSTVLPSAVLPASPSSRLSRTQARAPAITAMPTGTLTAKIHGQEKLLVSQPPRSGPRAAAPAITAPHTPNAAARSRPRKVAFTLERVDGRIAAPPTPWSRRAAISVPPELESAASTEASTNTPTPAISRRRLPSRSPSRPAISSSADSTTA